MKSRMRITLTALNNLGGFIGTMHLHACSLDTIDAGTSLVISIEALYTHQHNVWQH